MKPIICPSCGWMLRKPEDISVSFVHRFRTAERWPPCSITFVLRCRFCGGLLKEVTKEGEEAVELWWKLDQKISESAH